MGVTKDSPRDPLRSEGWDRGDCGGYWEPESTPYDCCGVIEFENEVTDIVGLEN